MKSYETRIGREIKEKEGLLVDIVHRFLSICLLKLKVDNVFFYREKMDVENQV